MAPYEAGERDAGVRLVTRQVEPAHFFFEPCALSSRSASPSEQLPDAKE